MKHWLIGIWVCLMALWLPTIPLCAQTLTPTAGATICTGTNQTLSYAFASGSGGCNYNLVSSLDGGAEVRTALSTGNSGNYTFNTNTPGTYVVFVEKVDCSSSGNNAVTPSRTIIVLAQPTVSLTGVPAEACVDDVVSATSTISYQGRTDCDQLQLQRNTGSGWTNVGSPITLAGALTQAITLPTGTADDNVDFRVILSCTSTGCNTFTSTSSEIDIIANPVVTLGSLATTACVGSTQNLVVSIAQNGRQSCNTLLLERQNGASWTTVNTASIGTASSHTFSVPTTTAGTFTYRARLTCSVSDCNDYPSTNTRTIEIVAAPTVSITPIPSIACQNDLVTLTATVNLNGRSDCGTIKLESFASGSWSTVGSTASLSGNTQVFTIPTATAGTRIYRVSLECTNTVCGAVTSVSDTIQVFATPVLSLTNSLPASACVGSAQSLTVGIAQNGRTNCGNLVLERQNGASWDSITAITITPSFTSHTFTLPSSVAGTFVFRVRLSCTNTCTNYVSPNSTAIEFLTAPTVSITPIPATTCLNSVVNVTATVNLNGRSDCSTIKLESFNGSSWSVLGSPATLTGITQSFIIPTASAATTIYRVTLECSNSGCFSVSSVADTIQVLSVPVLTLTNTLPATACVGSAQNLLVGLAQNGRTNCGTLILERQNGATWDSVAATTVTSSTTSHTFALPSANAGTFVFRARLSCGTSCTNYTSPNSTAITFLAVPTITLSSVPSLACVDELVTVDATINFNGRPDCAILKLEAQSGSNWTQVGGSVSLSGSSHTFTIPTAIAGSSVYRVTLECTNTGCISASSATAPIQVLANPVVTLTNSLPPSVCVGASQVLNVSINYNGRAANCGTLVLEASTDNINWNQSGTAVALGSANTHSFTIPNGTAGSFFYRARLTCTSGSCNSYPSASQPITFLANPTISLVNTLPALVCENASVTLTTNFNFNGRINCNTLQLEVNNGGTWDPVGSPVAVAPPATSHIFSVPTSNVGTFEYRVRLGCSTSVCNSYNTNSQTISVIALPSIAMTPATTGPFSQCIGSSLNLSATISGNPGGCTSAAIVWQEALNSAGPWTTIAGATGSNATVTVSSGVRYYSATITCSSTPGCGLVRTSPVVVTGVLQPTISLAANKTNSCAGSAVVLTASILNQGVGCADFIWTETPQGGSATTLPGTAAVITVTPTINTVYRATLNCNAAGGCTNPSQNITITVSPQPSLTITPSTINPVCAMATVSLTANLAGGISCNTVDVKWESSPDNVTWSGTVLGSGATFTPLVNTSTYYRAFIECGATSGCTRTESSPVFVEVKPNPTVSVQATYPTSVCNAAVVSLQAVGVPGAGTCGYQWYASATGLPGSFVLIGSCNTANCDVTLNNNNRFVQVRYTCSGSACPVAELSAPVEIVVNGQPSLALSITPSLAKICANSSVTVAAALTGGVNCNINWQISQNGGISWVPLANNLSQVTVDTLTRNTIFKALTVCTGAGCLDAETTVSIEVIEKPQLNFNISVPAILCSGAPFGPASVTLSNPNVAGALTLRDSTAATGWASLPAGSFAFPAFNVTEQRLLTAVYNLTSHAGCGPITSDTLLVAPFNLPDTTGVVLNITPNYCFPRVQGVIELNPNLGYSYSLGSDTTTLQSVYNNLAPDTFTLIIESVVSGCRRTMQVILPDSSNRAQPFALSVGAMDLSGISCFGENDGWIRPNVQGGTSPFTFIYTNIDQGVIDTTQNDTIGGLATGTYKIVVQDRYGCELVDSNFFIFEPNLLDVFLVDDTVPCTGSPKGTLTAQPFGGTPPYTFTWTNPVASGPILPNVPPGTYTVELRDNNNCLVVGTGVVKAARELNVVIVDSSFGCGTTFRPNIDFVVSGGYSPFRYGINTATGAAIVPLTNSPDSVFGITLPLGAPSTFNLVVIDDSLCTVTSAVTVSQPPPAPIPVLTSQASRNGNANGTASVTTAYASYQWSNGGNTQTIAGLLPGNYTVTVADANGCTATGSVEVRLVLVSNIDDITSEGAGLLPARPNPFTDFTIIPFVLAQPADVKLSLYDVSGKEIMVINQGKYEPGEHEVLLNNHDLPNGIYYCRMVTGQIVRTQKLVILR